jgi:nicotinamidase-related amidase
MDSRRPVVVFWFAVVVDVVALGFAWSAWKAPHPQGATAIIATTVLIVATALAGRILVVVTRVKRHT